MKTVLFALALALAMPIGAQQPMTYARLCGATEGTGDNNDFCAIWAQNNWQGMRNALSVAIRQGRAQENRNRFYFDHKRGSERGAFIQLKRPWMGADWRVLQDRDWKAHVCDRGRSRFEPRCTAVTLVTLLRDRDGTANDVEVSFRWEWEDIYLDDGSSIAAFIRNDDIVERIWLDDERDQTLPSPNAPFRTYDGQYAYGSFGLWAYNEEVIAAAAGRLGGIGPDPFYSVSSHDQFIYSAEGLRALVECHLDEFGYYLRENLRATVFTYKGISHLCEVLFDAVRSHRVDAPAALAVDAATGEH